MPAFVTAWDRRTGREHYVTPAALAMDPNLTTEQPSIAPSSSRRPVRGKPADAGPVETPAAGEKE